MGRLRTLSLAALGHVKAFSQDVHRQARRTHTEIETKLDGAFRLNGKPSANVVDLGLSRQWGSGAWLVLRKLLAHRSFGGGERRHVVERARLRMAMAALDSIGGDPGSVTGRVLTSLLATHLLNDVTDAEPEKTDESRSIAGRRAVIDGDFDLVGLFDMEFKLFVPSVAARGMRAGSRSIFDLNDHRRLGAALGTAKLGGHRGTVEVFGLKHIDLESTGQRFAVHTTRITCSLSSSSCSKRNRSGQ